MNRGRGGSGVCVCVCVCWGGGGGKSTNCLWFNRAPEAIYRGGGGGGGAGKERGLGINSCEPLQFVQAGLTQDLLVLANVLYVQEP